MAFVVVVAINIRCLGHFGVVGGAGGAGDGVQAAQTDLEKKKEAKASARLAKEQQLLATLKEEAATRQDLSAALRSMNRANSLAQMGTVCDKSTYFHVFEVLKINLTLKLLRDCG